MDLRDILGQMNEGDSRQRREEVQAYWAKVRAGEIEPPFAPEPDYDCETCKDQGVIKYAVGIDDPRFGRFFPCPKNCRALRAARATQAMRRMEDMRRKAGDAPSGLYHHHPYNPEIRLTLESIKDVFNANENQCGAYNLVAEFADSAPDVRLNLHGSGRHSLMLYGDKGYGKTLLASAALHTLEDRGVAVYGARLLGIVKRVYDVFQTTRQANSAYDTRSEFTDTQIRQAFCDIPVLIIDEFELANMTNARMELVEEIINARYTQRMPTLITTNLNRDGLRKNWNGRIVDRILDSYWCYEVAGVKLRDMKNDLTPIRQ